MTWYIVDTGGDVTLNKKDDIVILTLQLKKELSNIIREKAEDIGVSKTTFITTALQKELDKKEVAGNG